MYFDAHTRLNSNQLFSSRKQELEFFQESGGAGLINIGANNIYNERGIEIASQSLQPFPNMIIKCSIGLHPYEVSVGKITPNNMGKKLEELYSLYTSKNKKHIVAIGEIGIDTHFPGSELTLSLQKEIFGLQCERARSLNLPIVVHTRSNRDATLEILQDYRDCSIYFHCRSYTPTEIKKIQDMFSSYYIGFDANISYSKAQNIRESLRYLVYGNTNYPAYIEDGIIPQNNKKNNNSTTINGTGIQNLLLETDAPYLPFKDRRGKTQHPHYIGDIYSYIEQLLGLKITNQITNNAKTYYNLY